MYDLFCFREEKDERQARSKKYSTDFYTESGNLVDEMYYNA